MSQVIVDCDPGHDDAVAILLAARHLDVLGITTVSGNQSLEKVTLNALRVLEFGGLNHISVIKGHARKLVEPLHHAVVHGESGLDGAELPEPSIRAQPGHAVDFIIDSAMSTNGLELVAIGPLTNIAAALSREPRLASFLRRINLMGGSLTFGNSTPAAEFNIRCDPEAAHIVLESGVPIRMAGLNLTNQAMVTAEMLDRIRGIGNKAGTIVAELWTFHCRQYKDLGIPVGAPLHDPCIVAWMIDSDLVKSCALHVAVELRGDHTRGMTVCDGRHLQGVGMQEWGVQGISQGAPPNAKVGVRLDVPRFFDLVLSSLAEYP